MAAPRHLGETFALAARRFGDLPAVVEGDGVVTYAELLGRVDDLARRLSGADLPPSLPVAVVARHGVDSLTAFLGVLRSGLAVAVLDPNATTAAGRERVGHLGAAAIVTDGSADRPALDAGLKQFDVREANAASGASVPVGRAEEPAVILFTSGSTGPQRAIVHASVSIERNVGVDHGRLDQGPEDVATWMHSLSTISGVTDSLRILLRGGRLLPIDLARVPLHEVAGLMDHHGASVVHLVPTVFRRLLDAAATRPFRSTRLLHLGGEPVVAADFAAFTECVAPPGRFLNNLGSSEVPTFYRTFLAHGDELDGAAIPFRSPIAGKRVRILDESGVEITRPDRPGALVVDTAYGALGWWDERSAQPVAYGDGPAGVPRYGLGDRAHWGADGALHHVGRADVRRKRLGRWVDASAVEAAIAGIDGVRECVVSWGGTEEAPELVAHCATRLAPGVLRTLIARRVDRHEVPTVVVLDELPVLPNGKVDRRRLSDGVPTLPEAQGSTVELSPTSRRALIIVADVLGVAGPVPGSASFVDLGGDSIHAIDLVHRLTTELDVIVDPEEVFAAPDLETFAHGLGRSRADVRNGTYVRAASMPAGLPVVACVGDQRVMAPIVSGLGRRTGLVHLRLDGLQTDTSLGLDIPELSDRYVEELRALGIAPSAVVGFSYGGLVAMELARRLASAPVGIVAIEPSVPGEPATTPDAFAGVPRRVGRSMRRRRSKGDAWLEYRPIMRRNIESFRPAGSLPCPVVIVSGNAYRNRWGERWRELLGEIEWIVVDAADHLGAVDAALSERWVDVLATWMGRSGQR